MLSVSTTVAELEARIARLELLIAAMSAEIVTRRLVVLDDEGQERIVAHTLPGGGDAEVAVYATPSHYVAIGGSHASCCPAASVAIITEGEVALMVGPLDCVCVAA
jgi:hypothetical protein